MHLRSRELHGAGDQEHRRYQKLHTQEATSNVEQEAFQQVESNYFAGICNQK